MAAVAFLFGACTNADPFEGITDNSEDNYQLPAGSGTEDDPYNVSAALVHDMDSSEVWVKGYIVGQIAGTSINADSQFGPDFSGAVYDDGSVSKVGTNLLIAATAEETSASACLVVQLPSGVLREELNLVQHPENDGKEVALKGKLIKYFSVAGMKETSEAKLEGVTVGSGGTSSSDDAKGDGTQNNPYNVAGAMAQNNSGASAWVKGYIVGQVAGSSLSDESQFTPPFTPAVYDDGTVATAGTNLLIADNADETNTANCMIVQLPAGDLRTALELVNHPDNHGKEVLIYGELIKYFGTYGLKTCTCAVFEGETIGTLPSDPVTPSITGDGSRNNPYNAAGAIAQNNSGYAVWVKSYIVGQVAGISLSSNAQFDAPFTVADGSTQGTNLLVADNADETNTANCLVVQLPLGAVRNGINLVDNPEMDGKEVLLYGELIKYFGTYGLKNVTCAIVDGTTYGTDPGTGDTPSEDAIFEESFATSLGMFTIYDKLMPSDLSYVWCYYSNYTCAKASAFLNSTAYETESWLVSPVITMNGKAATLTFDHAANYFVAADQEMKVYYSTDYTGDAAAATWQQLSIPTYATGWTFVSSGEIELPAAESVGIAFVYTSTASNSCTWEVRNVKVTQ